MSLVSRTGTFSSDLISTTDLSAPPSLEENKRILLICQGNLSFYREALQEINPRLVSVVTCKECETSSERAFEDIQFVDEYFCSGEVERVCFENLKRKDFKLIIATSETDILRSAQLRDCFKLPGQSRESALFFRDKIRMKELLKKEGIETPEFTRARSALDLLNFADKYSFPLIVKPARGYGSLQTCVLRNSQDIAALLDTKDVFDEFQNADLDIEQFIVADMYHVDGIIRNGQVHVIWPSKCINNCLQMIEGKPTGGYLLSQNNPLVTIINEFAIRVLKALPAPLDYGFHLELFLKDNKPIFCEIASRIGSPWINDLWINGMGIDLKREQVRAQALLSFSSKSHSNTPSKIIGGMIFPPRKGKVNSIPKNCNLKGVLGYSPFISIGEILKKPQGMLGHIAAFTLSADTENEMEEIIKSVQGWVQEHFLIYDSENEQKK